MQSNIKLRTVGEIISGGGSDEKYILIIDDSDNTGGYYIYTCKNSCLDNCYDAWVLNDDELNANISGYTIKWKEDMILPEWA